MWPGCVVVQGPGRQLLTGVVEAEEAVLGRLARRDVVQGDVVIFGSGQDRRGGELRAVVANDHAGPATAGDQGRQLTRYPPA